MIESFHTIVTACGLVVVAALLLGIILKRAARLMAKQGVMFCLIASGFLASMATKPPEPPDPPVPAATNTVTFALGDYGVRAGGGELVQRIEEGGDAVAPLVVAAAGWEFAAWDRPFTNVVADLTVNAEYTNTVYAITYEDEHAAAHANPPTFTVTDELVFAAPAAVEGYEFAGWTPSGIAFGTTGDVTVVAAWTEKPEPPTPPPEPPDPPVPTATNTVTFALGDRGVRAGGGELVQQIEEGGDAVAPLVAAAAGWEFAAWDRPFTNVVEDLTVNAEYTNTVYAITYVDEHAAAHANPPTFTVTDELVFAAPAAVEGYEFAGWTPPGIAFGTTGDVTVVAAWTEKPEPPTPPPEPPVKSEDWIGEIYVPTNEAGIPEGRIVVDSGTKATITVAGLPKGLVYDKTSETLAYDGAKMKDGNYAFVVSAKNANGYRTDRVVAFVSEGHSGEKDPLDWGETYCVGKSCRIACDAFAALSAKDTLSVSGLPSGLKLVKDKDERGWPVYWIEGTPTKAGRFTVKWKETHAPAKVEVQYYMTVDGTPSQYVEASAGDLPDGCKVTGSGVYDAGKKITLKATAAKGLVFAGWYLDAEFGTPAEADADYRNPTLTLTELPDGRTTYYPRFIEIRDDFCGEIAIVGWDGEGVPEGTVMVASESLPTVTASGLPAGLAFDKKTNALVFNEAKMKAGDYAFVLSAKNAGGYRNDRVVTFRYEAEPLYEPWGADYAVGRMVVDEPLDFEARTEKDTLKVSGLPSGLKLVTGSAEDEEGGRRPTYSLSGVPTKAGRYLVTWTETRYAEDGRGRLVKDAAASVTVKFALIVRGAPSRYVEVVAEGPDGCKVTGSGVYAAGATVKTSATASKACDFAGWYAEDEDEEGHLVTNAFDNIYAEFLGKDSDYRLPSQTWLCGTYEEDGEVMDTVPTVLVGRFVDKVP